MNWISVNQCLPEKNDEYIVNAINGVQTADWFRDDGEWRTVRTYGCDSGNEVITQTVTHWMLMPDSPKEATNTTKA